MNFLFKRPGEYPALTLAYIGDAVFEIYVRSFLVTRKNEAVAKLHKAATGYVKAASQSKYMEIIEDKLTEEELGAYKRGRNAHPKTTAKNADIIDYRRATGFEALIGYLYICGKIDRINEIMSFIGIDSNGGISDEQKI